jgi:hypothetical protein
MSPHDGGDDGGDGDGDGDGLLFAGVRFALAGFDPVTESQVRPHASPHSLAARLDAKISSPSVPIRFRLTG